MKICTYCGNYVPDEAYSCPFCSSVFVQNFVPAQPYVITNTVKQKVSAGAKTAAAVGLILSLVGLILFFVAIPAAVAYASGKTTSSGVTTDEIAYSGLSAYVIAILAGALTSILGTVFSSASRNRIPSGVGGRGVATGGMVVGIIGIVFNVMQVVFGLCAAGFTYAAYQSSMQSTVQTLLLNFNMILLF